MSLIVMDIEASGFGYGSYPIEIGFVMEDQETHCRLIKPHELWTHWSEEAEQVHHIDRDTLQKYGYEVQDMARWLNGKLRDKTVYSDGWSHDLSWLGKLFETANVMQAFRLESIATKLNQEKMEQWHDEKESVMGELDLQRHRASSDALIIQRTYLNLSDD